HGADPRVGSGEFAPGHEIVAGETWDGGSLVKDDYLWDRSGEPDPELDKIERELGRFRYRPRPLDLPAAPQPLVWTRYAAAAAILVGLLAVSVWLSVRRQNPSPATDTTASSSGPNSSPPEAPPNSQPIEQPTPVRSPGSAPPSTVASHGNTTQRNRAAKI